MSIQVLDHGFVRFVEDWGRGDAGEAEAGIIEAARQSTQGSFFGWEDFEVGPASEPVPKVPEGHYCLNGKLWKYGDKKLLGFLYNNRPSHATPFEFAGLTIETRLPIFVTREWHRHRTQSYNEMSARYAPLPDMNYIPSVERLMMNANTKNKQAGAVKGAEELTEAHAVIFREKLTYHYEAAESTYQFALKMGVPKELARVHLPVGRYTQMRASANLRNWLAFMTLRADPGAQWEIQQYAQAVGKIIEERFPRTWGLYLAARPPK